MSLRRTALLLAALLTAAGLLFEVCARQLSGAWFTFGIHPQVMRQLETSLADQKRLAALDPHGAAGYRRRFAALETLLGRLRILEYNRDEVTGRYRGALLAVFAALALGGGALSLAAKARQLRRLDRLHAALERDRRRLASLENLSAWQEAARRHAHEIRTPLTAARLDLARLHRLLGAGTAAIGAEAGPGPGSGPGGNRAAERALAESVLEDLDRLGRFTHAFTSFARLPSPLLERHDLAAFLAEFVAHFGGAWPNLALALEGDRPPRLVACFDRDMLRQVLVNLCDNSSLALAAEPGRAGSVRFALGRQDGWVTLDAADDGPGIPREVQPRLFEPYVTTRRVGEGMGLGLAISRKILLDHGGDLELLHSSAAGSAFRLLLPARAGREDAMEAAPP
ncbi:MAG TPA: ATP-binding protein [Thermoanaerobaculia bacterium]|nr:ATP-binding protein [Thermoanaerobaculia bacterium]